MSHFEETLNRYALLLLKKGVNLKPGEYLVISADVEHRDIVLKLLENAYRMGASMVNVIYRDDRAQRIRLENSSPENLSVYPQGIVAELKSLLDKRGSYLSISGVESPDIFEGIDSTKVQRLISARYEKTEFFTRAIMDNEIKWTVAAASTTGLAEKVLGFKGNVKKANEKDRNDLKLKLWHEIFKVCMVEGDDYMEKWNEHNAKLKEYISRFNEARIEELHFKAPGTDLTVGLHEKARWVGGVSVTSRGEEFMANIPTEEIYTAPDFRRVNGVFESTRPLLYRNILVERFGMRFEEGKVTDVWGSDGVESIMGLLEMDEGARYAGEIALVEKTSRVYESGLVFYDLLYDENAACHIALGAGYPECIEGGEELDDEGKREVGLNSSKLHMDIMIGSPELDITARLYDGREVEIMRQGLLIGEFTGEI